MLRQLCRENSKPTFRGRRSSLNQWIRYRILRPQNFISSTSAASRNGMLSAFKQETRADAFPIARSIADSLSYQLLALLHRLTSYEAMFFLAPKERAGFAIDAFSLVQTPFISTTGLSRECEIRRMRDFHIKVLFCINITRRKGVGGVIRNHAAHYDPSR